jgi:hypothetical protein
MAHEPKLSRRAVVSGPAPLAARERPTAETAPSGSTPYVLGAAFSPTGAEAERYGPTEALPMADLSLHGGCGATASASADGWRTTAHGRAGRPFQHRGCSMPPPRARPMPVSRAEETASDRSAPAVSRHCCRTTGAGSHAPAVVASRSSWIRSPSLSWCRLPSMRVTRSGRPGGRGCAGSARAQAGSPTPIPGGTRV